jgi:PLP dependent protein
MEGKPALMIVAQQPHTGLAEWQARIRENLMMMGYPEAPYWKQTLLVGVTKHADATMTHAAFLAGIHCMGENKAVEAMKKRAELPPEVNDAIEWHFIGHIQKNKLNKIVGHYDVIHSVESPELMYAISEKAVAQGVEQLILIQVNVSGEASKQGVAPDALPQMLEEAAVLAPHIQVIGLMTMAPAEADEPTLDACFGGLAQLRDAMQTQLGVKLPHLSMGMSDDYAHALAHGATIVRIGSKLFA